MVMRANGVISGIEKYCPLDESEKGPFIAEAKIMRAFANYFLTCFFGDVPFYTDDIWRADQRYWQSKPSYLTEAAVPEIRGEYKLQQTDPVTSGFIAYLKKEPLLKAILTGHMHITIQDQFSPTAREYVIGGNFMFHGEEVLFA